MKKIILIALLFSMADIWGPCRLTVVSYNVGVFNKYVKNSSPEVAAMMREIGADVIGLCELDSCSIVRNQRRDQLAEFVDQMGPGWFGHFGKAMSFGGGGYGVGAVIGPRFRVRESYTIPLPKGKGSEPRAAAVVETERFIFACAHLDFADGPSRLRQAEILSEATGKPVILCGDMNAAPDNATMEFFRQNWDIITSEDPTFPSNKPRSCIDYIMILRGSCEYDVIGHAGVRKRFWGGNPKTASDHLPIIARIRLR